MAVIELVTESYTPSAPRDKAAETSAPAAAPVDVVEPPVEEAPAEVEATGVDGATEVVETEAADVETAEAQSEASVETEPTQDEKA
jgi:large subunit ribosomal protein L17